MSDSDNQRNDLALDRIFRRLAATYGAAWDRSLGAAPLADVRSVWSNELQGLFQSRSAMLAVAWALDNLPERCVNAIEFRNLCRNAPAQVQPVLACPAADPQRVAQELERLGHTAPAPAPSDPKQWAFRLKALHDAGGVVTLFQVQCYRRALGMGA